MPLNMRRRKPRTPFFAGPHLDLFRAPPSCRLSLHSRSPRRRGILEPISFTRSTHHYQTGCCRCCSCNVVPRFSHAHLVLQPSLIERWFDALEINLRDSPSRQRNARNLDDRPVAYLRISPARLFATHPRICEWRQEPGRECELIARILRRYVVTKKGRNRTAKMVYVHMYVYAQAI